MKLDDLITELTRWKERVGGEIQVETQNGLDPSDPDPVREVIQVHTEAGDVLRIET